MKKKTPSHFGTGRHKSVSESMSHWLFKFFLGEGRRPKQPLRSPAEQSDVDAQTKRLTLYHFETCPYCLRVRRAIRKLQLQIELRDLHKNPDWRDELSVGGGKRTVPCLRIKSPTTDIRWMYESADIVAYLKKHFSA